MYLCPGGVKLRKQMVLKFDDETEELAMHFCGSLEGSTVLQDVRTSSLYLLGGWDLKEDMASDKFYRIDMTHEPLPLLTELVPLSMTTKISRAILVRDWIIVLHNFGNTNAYSLATKTW